MSKCYQHYNVIFNTFKLAAGERVKSPLSSVFFLNIFFKWINFNSTNLVLNLSRTIHWIVFSLMSKSSDLKRDNEKLNFI